MNAKRGMADDERRGNWQDADLVSLPPCPKCGAVNAPRAKPTIERIGKTALACNCCGKEWVPLNR